MTSISTYEWLIQFLECKNEVDILADMNAAIGAVATSAADAPIRDTRLDNIEAKLEEIIVRLVVLEKAATITPKPSPTPKPLPEADVIVTPDIVAVVVTPVKPIKQIVKKRKTKGQIEKKATTSKKK